MVELGSFAVSLCQKFGADVVELRAFADQRFTLVTQFDGEDFLGDILPDSRFRSVEFQQFASVGFVEQLPLSVEFGLPGLLVSVDSRQCLLQPFAFSGDFAADLGQQAEAIGFELFAAFCEIGLFTAKLFDGRLLQDDLFRERRIALPQDVLFGLQLLFGLLLPEP